MRPELHAGDARDQSGDLDPGFAAQAALGDAIGARGGDEQRVDVGAAQALQRRPDRPLPAAPDLLGAEDAVDVAVVRLALQHARDGAQVVEQRPQDQRRLAALAAQAVEDAQRARRIAEERGGRQFEHVVARVVGDEFGDRVGVERRAGLQQRDALDLLLRGEQVALDAIGEQLRGRRLERDAVLLQAARDPVRAGARASSAARRPRCPGARTR